MLQGTPTSPLVKQMCEDLGPYQHHNVPLLDFARHIWGLDRNIGRKILEMDIKLDPQALYAYRTSESEGELFEPFIAFAKILYSEVLSRLNEAGLGETTIDHFWEDMETGRYLMTTWAAQRPSEDAEPNLCIAKHILEFKHNDRYRDTGPFLSRRQRARILDTFTSTPKRRFGTRTVGHRTQNSDGRAVPESESSDSESDVLPFDSHSRKRRRGSEGSSNSQHQAKRCRLYERAHLLDYATECLAATSRRWVTGLLIDTCEVTACYFDRHMVACSSSFRFDRSPSMLALAVYAMTACDRERAGFDPYLLPSPLRGAPSQLLQTDVGLPVAEVVGSFFDFTFSGSGEYTREGEQDLGDHASLDRDSRCEEKEKERKEGKARKRKGERGREDEPGKKEGGRVKEDGEEKRKKENEGRYLEAADGQPDADEQDPLQPYPHRSTCFRVVECIRQPDDLITRGTTVYKVQRRLSSGTFSDEVCALKFSWAMKNRLSEIDAIQHLRTALPESSHEHIPYLFFAQSWTAEQLQLPWLGLKLSLNDENHQERVLRVFASNCYKKLWQVGSVENFKQAWLDCVEICYLAFRVGKLLHRDLSENNIMVLPCSHGGVKGVVNDWDMAMFVHDQEDQTPESGHGTGTPLFMARELLYPGSFRIPTPHWFRHDLESLFYVLIWAAVQYNLDQGTRDEEYHPFLERWTRDAATNSCAKAAFIAGGRRQEEELLAAVKPEFEQVAKEWILPLRTLFRNAEFYGDEDLAHDPVTYGGRLTFKAFMAALKITPRTWGIPHYLEND